VTTKQQRDKARQERRQGRARFAPRIECENAAIGILIAKQTQTKRKDNNIW
jgi:hypothetical protein